MTLQRPPAEGRTLSEDSIIEAARELTHEVGVERLTMRALADALGVSPMATYYYVKGRDSLLLLMVERVMSEVTPPDPSSDEPWEVRLWTYMSDMREALARYPGIDDFLLRHELSRAGRRYMENCIAILVAGGFTPADARSAFSVIYTYMWGGSIFLGMQNRRRAAGRRRSKAGAVPTLDELASLEGTKAGYQTIVAGLQRTYRLD
jgi:AcrR family transcriptional regulator